MQAKGYFVGWPGLTSDKVRKFYTPKKETTRGHMRQVPSNIRSTQKDLLPLPQKKSQNKRQQIETILIDSTKMRNMLDADITG